VGSLGTRDPTIELSAPIHEEVLDKLVMAAMGLGAQDLGSGEALEAFHASNRPPIDGPLIGVVSLPSVHPSEVGPSPYRCSCCLSSFN
jgi:hypothetical protein